LQSIALLRGFNLSVDRLLIFSFHHQKPHRIYAFKCIFNYRCKCVPDRTINISKEPKFGTQNISSKSKSEQEAEDEKAELAVELNSLITSNY